jgi:hypothetical protein
LTRKGSLEAKEVLGDDIEHILVKGVGNQHGIPSVSFSTMDEHQRLQEFELTDCIVSGSCSLLSFFSEDAHSNMGLEDHIDVVCTVSNGESHLIWESLLDHVDDISFLFWRNSASENNIYIIRGFQE